MTLPKEGHDNEIVLFIDKTRASDVNATGNRFTYRLNPPLKIPPNANPRLSVLEADMFYTSPNVSAAKNNNSLKFSTWEGGTLTSGGEVDTPHTNLVDFELIFEDGLYSLEEIRLKIVDFANRELDLDDGALNLRGVASSQKVQIDYDAESTGKGILFNFTDVNSIGKLLGFTENKFFDYFDAEEMPPGSRPQHFHVLADETANFDSVSSFHLRLSCLAGMNFDTDGQQGGQIAANIAPDVDVGSVIRYRPFNPLPLSAEGLRGATSSIIVTITDNLGQDVQLNETFSARILITY